MSDDQYACVAKGKLKLKNDSKISKKKKHSRKNKERDSLQRVIDEASEVEATASAGTNNNSGGRQWTKAEQSFQLQQEKMRNKRIMEKAATTHKQRVEKFNQGLDALTEHFDIPKVSWTK